MRAVVAFLCAATRTFLFLDQSDASDCSDFVAVAEATNSYQEVFSRTKLRELVLSYWKDSNPISTRRSIATENIWNDVNYDKPSEPVSIMHRHKPDDDSPEPGATPPSGRGPLQPKPSTPQPTTLPVSESSSTREQVPNPVGLDTGWAYPKISQLLSDYRGGAQDSAADGEWLKQVESQCKGALQQFQLQSKLLSGSLTPNAALLKFQGSANLTVEQVLRRRSEFLTTPN